MQAHLALMLGPPEMLVILLLGVLIFGRRLPEVGRSLGKGVVEFKKGIKGIEDDVKQEVDEAERRSQDQREVRDAEAPSEQ